MKHLAFFILLWQSYLIPAADMELSPIGLKNISFTAINNGDKETAITSFARFALLVVADSKYFNPEQVQYLSKLYDRFSNGMKAKFGVSDISACMLEAKKREISWLLAKMEKNQFHSNWEALLGEFDYKQSENEVKNHQIASLTELKKRYDE